MIMMNKYFWVEDNCLAYIDLTFFLISKFFIKESTTNTLTHIRKIIWTQHHNNNYPSFMKDYRDPSY
jgi:hypothetical protein